MKKTKKPKPVKKPTPKKVKTKKKPLADEFWEDDLEKKQDAEED